jgi:hypothetical protein
MKARVTSIFTRARAATETEHEIWGEVSQPKFGLRGSNPQESIVSAPFAPEAAI